MKENSHDPRPEDTEPPAPPAPPATVAKAKAKPRVNQPTVEPEQIDIDLTTVLSYEVLVNTLALIVINMSEAREEQRQYK